MCDCNESYEQIADRALVAEAQRDEIAGNYETQRVISQSALDLAGQYRDALEESMRCTDWWFRTACVLAGCLFLVAALIAGGWIR